jgi:hypothetical protein
MSGNAPVIVSASEHEEGSPCPHCGQTLRRGDVVAVCRECASRHHQHCWERYGRCGSYACAPARIDVPQGLGRTLSITPQDLDRAAPQPAARRPLSYESWERQPSPEEEEATGINGLALAGFITAVLGIFLCGLPGLVAILLGCLALGSLNSSKQRGTGLAFAAIFLGLADVVGWLVLLFLFPRWPIRGHGRPLDPDPEKR